MLEIKEKIEKLYRKELIVSEKEFYEIAEKFIELLNKGEVRSAQKDKEGNWVVNSWVKEGILLLFKFGRLVDFSSGKFSYFDKHTLDLHPFSVEDGVRIVPGGSAIRNGAYIAKGVICMPPMYVNIGAYVDEDTMLDSHSLVGTCAQIGKRVHISAGSQIGGVLEPIGANPVIIEDDVLIGGNCGIYEGAIVKQKAVLGAGVILTSSTKVYDIVNEKVIQKIDDKPLIIPEGAVVVAGARAIESDFARKHNLSIYTPLIIKYRDLKTESKIQLEDLLR